VISSRLTARTPVGIDVGAKQIKAAQLRSSGRGWRAEALCAVPRSDPGGAPDEQEVHRLSGVLKRHGFEGRSVVLALPGDKLLRGVLDVPQQAQTDALERITRTELARMHKVPRGSFELSYWKLPPAAHLRESAEQVMALGCPHEEANYFLDLFEGAGMDVLAIDAQITAVIRACRPLFSARPYDTAVLEIGWSNSTLSIVGSDVVCYERVLSGIGYRKLVETARQRLDLQADAAEQLLASGGLDKQQGEGRQDLLIEEAAGLIHQFGCEMTEELLTPFAYVANQYGGEGVSRVLLVGGCASVPGLAEYLDSALEPEVTAVTPDDLVCCPQRLRDKARNSALTGAIGLAQFGEET